MATAKKVEDTAEEVQPRTPVKMYVVVHSMLGTVNPATDDNMKAGEVCPADAFGSESVITRYLKLGAIRLSYEDMGEIVPEVVMPPIIAPSPNPVTSSKLATTIVDSTSNTGS